MRYLSNCDGIGAAHLAWQPRGWSCVGVSETAQFPTAAVRHHYGFRRLGNMTGFPAWPEELVAGIELVAAGTPCQPYSVAGKRLGLADERGALLLDFADQFNHVNMIRRKHGLPPALILLENVPRLLGSNDNAFGEFVSRVLGCDAVPETKNGKWPKAGLLGSETARVSWRILDSQHFAVAQRRKRVFLLGVPTELIERFGDRVCPSRILSLRSSGAVKTLTLKVRGGISQASWVAKPSEWVSGSLDLPWLKGVPGVCSLPCRVNLSEVLEAGPVDEKYYITREKALHNLERAKAKRQKLPPLYEAVLMKVASGSRGIAGDLATWTAKEAGNCADLPDRHSGDPIVVPIATSEVANTLTVCLWDGFRSNGLPKHGLVIEGDRLRLLIPREWERLMGFPDNFTLIPNRKNELAKDSLRFAGLGNSIVVPILSWIAQQIEQGFTLDSGLGRLHEQRR
jgi:DNA (cytosine-5)-methyltransferase 1